MLGELVGDGCLDLLFDTVAGRIWRGPLRWIGWALVKAVTLGRHPRPGEAGHGCSFLGTATLIVVVTAAIMRFA